MGKLFDEKTEWVIEGPFGKRRIWKDSEGFYYLVNNIAFRSWDGESDEIKVYKAKTVNNGGDGKP